MVEAHGVGGSIPSSSTNYRPLAQPGTSTALTSQVAGVQIPQGLPVVFTGGRMVRYLVLVQMAVGSNPTP